MIQKLIPAFIKQRIKNFILSQHKPNYRHGYKNPSGKMRENVTIGNTVMLFRARNINIDDYVHINHYTYLDGSAPINIGEGTQIGCWVGIYTHSSHLAIRLEGRDYWKIRSDVKKAYFLKPVTIGKYVFIGNGALIMGGVTIGDGSFILPGSFVTTDVPARSIVKGTPGKVTGTVDKIDQRYLQIYPELKKTYYDQNFVSHLNNTKLQEEKERQFIT